jgi:transcriptional regulator with XRE-family HTH domain
MALVEIVSAARFLWDVVKDFVSFKARKPTPVTAPTPYRVQLGRRVRDVREAVGLLGKPAVMADILGLDEVSALERYESGDTEMSVALLEKMAKELFISMEFLRGGSGAPFVAAGSHQYPGLLEDGFRPLLLGHRGVGRETIWRIAFMKRGKGYTRFVCSLSIGRFVRATGGGQNLTELIFSMLTAGLDWPEVAMRMVSAEASTAMTMGCYYCVDLDELDMAPIADEDTFAEWYREIRTSAAALAPRAKAVSI